MKWNKAFDDCKAVFLCSKVSEYSYHVSNLVQLSIKAETAGDVVKIILRYLGDKSYLIGSETVLIIDDQEVGIKIVDKELMILQVNGKNIKMIKPIRIVNGQMKSGTVTLNQKE